MCGRYTISNRIEALAERFNATMPKEILTPTYNAAPSQVLPTIFNTHPHEIADSNA